MRHLLPVLLLLLVPLPAFSQGWHATFAEGVFRSLPWAGDTTQWRIVPFGADRALHTAGPPASDTLILSRPSGVGYGAWEAVVRYEGGTLSTFNHVRLYLIAGDAAAPHAGAGYHLQIGSNARDLRLYRSDASGNRTLLGASAAGVLDADARTVSVRVERSALEVWRVELDGALAVEASDDAPVAVAGIQFALWVKHTRARGASFWFDDLSAEAIAEEAPADPVAAGDVTINEIQFAPDPPENEYVELLNRTDRLVDLRALTLADNRDEPVAIVAEPYLLAPGAYVVLARDTAQFSRAFPGTAAVQVATWPALNNSDDSVIIRAGATVVDRVDYQASWGEARRSLERRDPAAPASFAGNWGASVDPAGGTPGRQNSLFAPDNTPPAVLLAEAEAADALLLFLDEPFEPGTVASARFDAGATPARVEALGSSVLRLVFAAPIGADAVRIAGLADLAGNRIVDAMVTIAHAPRGGELIVNEILYEPRSDPSDGLPDQPEYVEILNVGQRRLSLRRLALAGPVDEHGAADTLRHASPYAQLDPGGHAVFAAGGDLPAAFPASPAGSPLLAAPGSSLGLGNSGDLVRLVMDGATGGPDLDAVLYSPGWHYPFLADTRGIALERRAAAAPAADAASWTSSVDPEGGTPGRRNSVWQAPVEAREAGALVTVVPSPFSPDGDGHDDAALIRYTLPEAPSVLRVRIYDRAGRPVRQLTAGHLSGPEGTLVWDGTDNAGDVVDMGIYVLLFEALYAGRGKVETRKAAIAVARTARRN